MNSGPLDSVPVWCFFPISVLLGMLCVEVGYRIGRWRHARASGEKDAPVAAMVASLLGLLAFMLAFTFSLAATRFDARRQVVLEEANAIGTTFLRSRLLPEPQKSEIAHSLRQYAELRSCSATADKIVRMTKRSPELHEELWSIALTAAEKDPRSITTGLFLESLNEMIDLHAKRVFVGLRSRIPGSIWVALFSLTLLGLSSIGYQAGLAVTRRSPEMPVLTLAFAVVLLLIVDLDRGQEGWLRVSQQPIVETFEMIDRHIREK